MHFDLIYTEILMKRFRVFRNTKRVYTKMKHGHISDAKSDVYLFVLVLPQSQA